jgi:glycosyltransferase involved in cell wall biosynthesis
MAAKIAGIKTLATPHGFENAKDLKLQTFIWLGSRTLKYFDTVAPLSDELVSDMRKIGIPMDKIHLIRNGVDLEELEAVRNVTREHRQLSDAKSIGYVGQMAYRKNLGDLLRAFDLLYHDHKNVHLILIGDGPIRQELEDRTKSMGLTNQVKFLGYRTDRLRIIKGLDLFCMTSSLEGIPRCMMEAMALEVPVVAFNIPGVNKLIIQGKTGLMAPFGNVKELKQCIERVLFDGNFSKEIAFNGRNHVIKNFSAQLMADEYTHLYQELII